MTTPEEHRIIVHDLEEDINENNFPSKKEILALLVKQEELRQKLCYGKNKDLFLVEEAIRAFFDLKSVIEKEMGEKI